MPAFERAIFGLEAGDISEPVLIESDRGETYNLFFIESREAKAAKEYTEVRDRIYNQLFTQAAEKEYDRWVVQLRERGFVDVRIDKPL